MVSLQFLLEGAAYSLQNSGVLIQDAVKLCSQKSFTSAVVLAMFGREELGKHKMLRAFYNKLAKGEVVTCDEIKDAITKHVAKQERGMLSLLLQPGIGDRLHQALIDQLDYDPQSKECKKLEEVFQERQKEIGRELPKKRHYLRMGLLYVEPTEDCASWQCPSDLLSEETALREVIHAVGDFNIRISKLVERKDCSDAFGAAFQNWTDRPSIPFVDHLHDEPMLFSVFDQP